MHFSFFFMSFVLFFCFDFFWRRRSPFSVTNTSLFCIFQSCVHYREVNLYRNRSAGPALLTDRCPLFLFFFRGTSLRISLEIYHSKQKCLHLRGIPCSTYSLFRGFIRYYFSFEYHKSVLWGPLHYSHRKVSKSFCLLLFPSFGKLKTKLNKIKRWAAYKALLITV